MSFFGSRRQTTETEPVAAPQKQPELPHPAIASQAPVGFETVMGANSALEGTLRSSANIRLDGTFTGTLEITGNVLIGETAKINADVNARNISIAGAVRGNISGKKVQILRTGRVWGDIRAAALTTEEGAFIDGKITMVPKDGPKPPSFDETTPAGETTLTPAPQPPDYDRQVEGVTPVGMGATEEDPDDMIHEAHEAPSGYGENSLIENISQGDELPAQTDSNEGQANVDPTDHTGETDADTDETRQST